jgi:flavin reductase (DIM6/NTAB) family NADH-FMN oxidoreductase RutF
MTTSNALNILLAVALVFVCARLYYATTPAFATFDAVDSDSDETVRDFHEGHTLPEAPAKPASASDFALAALGADAAALPVPKADAVTTATPSAKKEEPAPTVDEFKPFDVKREFADNPFDIFTGKGMLLCAGDREKSNAMTIGWGGLGTLWGRNDAVTVYVAEKRHTKLFMDKAAYFTVMAFDKEKQANILDYMGRNSGRDGDKAAALGLHLAYTERGTPYYEEAEMVLECEMMYSAPFDPAGMRDVPQKLYSNFPAGVHTMYIGRIVSALHRP